MEDCSSISVLIVDDEVAVRESLQGYFEDREFVVVSAESAEKMLEMLEDQDFDCAIIDMRLPGMDGNSVIIKAKEIQPKLEFLIYTGSTDYQVPLSLTEMGITNTDVFHKPLPNMSVITEAVCEKVKAKRQQES